MPLRDSPGTPPGTPPGHPRTRTPTGTLPRLPQIHPGTAPAAFHPPGTHPPALPETKSRQNVKNAPSDKKEEVPRTLGSCPGELPDNPGHPDPGHLERPAKNKLRHSQDPLGNPRTAPLPLLPFQPSRSRQEGPRTHSPLPLSSPLSPTSPPTPPRTSPSPPTLARPPSPREHPRHP